MCCRQAAAHVAAKSTAAADRRSWRRDQKDLLDEMLPKATAGREQRVSVLSISGAFNLVCVVRHSLVVRKQVC